MAKLFALPGPIASAACGWVCGHRRFAARLAVATHPNLPGPVAEDSVAHTWASYTGTLTNVVLAAEASTWLPGITVPVTLVAGDRDRVVDHRHLELLGSHRAIRSLTWPGDHHLPLGDPGRCIELLESVSKSSS